jgi:hypothetical protein
MNLTTIRSTLALCLSIHLGIVSAAPPAIGTVLASGAFRVDSATVTGNATLFEGSVLETHGAPSSIQLHSGARVSLNPESRGRLFGDRLVLEKGSSDLENATGFRLVALGLTVQPDRGSSTGRISFEGTRRVRVAATGGSLRVLNASGMLVANLGAGSALAFEPQEGPSNVTRVTGEVATKAGHSTITDEVTKVTVEVVGMSIEKETGHRCEVLGTMDPTATPVASASQVVRAREIHCGDSKKAATAAAAGAGGAAGGATIAGVTAGTVAVVGGVAAAATVGGLAAAKKLPGQGDSGPESR